MNKTEQLRKPKPYHKKKVTGIMHGSRGVLLYILPLTLIPAAILSFVYADFMRILVNISGCASYLLAASLLRKGLAAETEYRDKNITQAPKWPLKTLSALLVALTTTGIALLSAGHDLFIALTFGLGALAGMALLYGFDPRQEKMVAGVHGYTAEEIVQTIDEAEAKISGIEFANKQINNWAFTHRIQLICEHAREILGMLEEDPGDIRRARKFLNIYLDGAFKVTEGYAEMHNKQPSKQLTENFDHVLQTIESVFIEQKQKLLEDDALNLDVQIEVLTAQLKHEGVM